MDRKRAGERIHGVGVAARPGGDGGVRAEIEASGFRHTRTIEILTENFFLEFELPAG